MAQADRFHILLIRAGATSWEAESRLEGQSDLPLSDVGQNELEQRAQDFAGTELASVLSGPDQASLATARAIAKVTGCKTRSVAGLEEVDLGLWEGLTRRDLAEKFPKAAKSWFADPTSVQVPEGESIEQAEERLVGALAKALKKSKGVLPGLGLVLRPVAYALVRSWAEGVPISSMWSMDSEACGSVWLELERERLSLPVRVSLAKDGV